MESREIQRALEAYEEGRASWQEPLCSTSSAEGDTNSPVVFGGCNTETSCSCTCHKAGDAAHSNDGEKNYYIEWAWDVNNKTASAELLPPYRDVLFHKHFSNGTAAVRGEKPLTEGQHYWEIKMITSVYGTDMMVGIGTANVDLNEYVTRFVSLLGMDADSWGLSYSGHVMHNGLRRHICKRFGQGVVIGFHLDMWLGRLSIFRNGKCLGVSFSQGVRGKEIYPIACSTAARTGMRIVRSCSFPTSLQFLCCQALRKCIPADVDVTKAVSLAPGVRLFLENNLDWLLRPCAPEVYNASVCALRKRSLKCIHEQLTVDRHPFMQSKKPKLKSDNQDGDEGSAN